jgi:hypothetical protein
MDRKTKRTGGATPLTPHSLQLPLDERLPSLLLDALAPVEAAIASVATQASYAAMLSAVNIDQDRRHEILRATEAVVAKHPGFFAEYRSELEFLVPLMAINATQVGHVFMQQAGSRQLVKPCSAAEALVIGLMVFAPLALLALIFVFNWRK